MNINQYIENKEKKGKYSKQELQEIIMGYVSGDVTDKQMVEFLKTIFEKGANIEEISDMTEIMMKSGEVIDLSEIPGIKVDKHSTGGVGDKVSLIASPIVASLGANVAKMSGRGLGFTGGTIDKLESIPGYRTNLSTEEFINNVKKHKIAITGQTKNIVPADKKIYALRDETGLIESIALIASSIMSKKLATGADAILLDVKCGNAAFMKTKEKATELAKVMVMLGEKLNKDVRVEITSMDLPLGRAIGNKNEVLEAIEALKGNWTKDLKEIIYSTSSTILQQAKIYKTKHEAIMAIDETISSGIALEKFNEWIEAQSGNSRILKEPNKYWKPKFEHKIKATKDGFINIKSAVNFGIAAMELGAGRKHKEDSIDFDAGIWLHKKTGEKAIKNQVIFSLYSSKPISKKIIKLINESYEIIDKVISKPIIISQIQ